MKFVLLTKFDGRIMDKAYTQKNPRAALDFPGGLCYTFPNQIPPRKGAVPKILTDRRRRL